MQSVVFIPKNGGLRAADALPTRGRDSIGAPLPAEPFRLARQFDGLDLLELDGALLDQIVELAVGRTGNLRSIEIDLERAAVILVGPGRVIADALHAGRHPAGL